MRLPFSSAALMMTVRRFTRPKRPAAEGVQFAGHCKPYICEVLDHAQHDRADKGECEIRGNDAQPADESHGKPPLGHVAGRINAQSGNLFPHKKSQPCCSIAAGAPHAMIGNVVKYS